MTHTARLPVGWRPPGTARARALLRRAVESTSRLRTFRIAERLTSGLGGGVAVSRYVIAGRHRYAITARNAGPSRTIVIGRNVWLQQHDGSWMHQRADPIDVRQLMPWWLHRRTVRLLTTANGPAGPVATVALADFARPGSFTTPFWFRLRIDVRSGRVLRMRMIAPGHFMTQRYAGFDAPARVRPPRR